MCRPFLAPLAALALALCACGSGGGADPGPSDMPAEAASDLPADVPGDPGADPGRPDLPVDVPQDPAPDAPPTDAADAADATDATADLPADTPSDTPDAPPPPAPHPLFDYVGHVVLEEQGADTIFYGTLEARFGTAPDPLWHQRVNAEGACELWMRVPEYPTTCTPDCGWDAWCGADSTCHLYGQRVGAGLLTVDALGGPYTLTPDDTDWYAVAPEPAANLFEPKSTVRVRAAGGAVPAFDVSLPGMVPLDADPVLPLVLEDDADTVITWTPANDGAVVEVIFQTGHHIPPPTTILFCQVPESAGQLVIPKAVIQGMAPIGGPSLFPHPSFLRKVRRVTLVTAWGPLEVALSSRVGVSIEHNAW
jgi:hypothetical protein